MCSSEQKEETEQGHRDTDITSFTTCLAVKALLAYSLERVKMGIERNSHTKILERLESKAQSLRKETDRIKDRRKKDLIFSKYLELISRIKKTKKSMSIELMRYEHPTHVG